MSKYDDKALNTLPSPHNSSSISESEIRSSFSRGRRIIVKVGTSTITQDSGLINLLRLEHIVRQVSDIANKGKEAAIVSSGAIGAGAPRLGLPPKPSTVSEKQAAAAVGQGVIVHMYEKLFGEYQRLVGQILITREDLDDRRRYLNARTTLLHLLRKGVIPIINENDTVSTDEIRFGDNDTLAALVATLVDADLLIILTDIDGLYTADPKVAPEASLVTFVSDEEISSMQSNVSDVYKRNTSKCSGEPHPLTDFSGHIANARIGSPGKMGTGGMWTKISAAGICSSSGIPTVIANGSLPHVLQHILSGEQVGTVFAPQPTKISKRASWLVTAVPKGKLAIDDGARKALVSGGKSLLPSGLVNVTGRFTEGSVVAIVDSSGKEVARGVVNYPSGDLRRIIGLHTSEVEGVLGYKHSDEVVHRDNMALTDRTG
jgi:glutamate 5-kinase